MAVNLTEFLKISSRHCRLSPPHSTGHRCNRWFSSVKQNLIAKQQQQHRMEMPGGTLGKLTKVKGSEVSWGINEGVLQLFLRPFKQCRSASETTTVHSIKTLNTFYTTADTSVLGNGRRGFCSILGRKSSQSRQAALLLDSTHQHHFLISICIYN